MNIEFSQIIPHPLKETEDLFSSEIWAQRDLNLSSPERILISAPSGKGKSTLLNILYGVRKDYDGLLIIDEENLTGASENSWNSFRTDRISKVFQGLELFDHLTAYENVQLKNELTRHKREDDILEMFSELGISNLKNQKTMTLSFGQKQRVAIIRSLCQPFKWLLLDEPFSHLDTLNSELALKLITKEADNLSAGIILTSLGKVDSEVFTKSLKL